MIVELAKFLSECPFLDEERVCVNYLDGVAPAYSLEATKEKGQSRQYTDGGKLCSRKFAFAMRGEYCGADSINRQAAKKCSDIEAWINSKSRAGQLPDMGDKITVISCEVTRGFAPVSTASVDARYEAELEIIFYSA